MSDLTSQAKLELEILVLGEATARRALEEYISTTDGAAAAVKKLQSEQDTSAAANNRYAASFGELIAKLKAATTAERELQQTAALRNNQNLPTDVASMTNEQARNVVAVSDAKSVDVVTEARKRVAALDAETAAAQKAQLGTTVMTREQAKAAASADHWATSNTSAAYSLMNISFQLALVGAALIGADALIVKTAIDFEREFASVARTTGVAGVAANSLKQSLIDLSTSIPVSFADLANIASLGGQLGIGASEIDNFSKTVAEFSATTNLTVDAAATALGRLGQLLPDVKGNYEGLASAILRVGVTSVATETQIVSIASQIAAVSTAAKLSTADVIGLSGTFASLGIAPEAARGLITRLFTNIEGAVSSGGKKLQDFGAISGQTGEQFAATWSGSPRAALISLFDGIQKGGDASIATLKALGVNAARDIPNLQKLVQNPSVRDSAFAAADSSVGSGAELTRQFGIIAETVASKLTLLKNNWDAFLASVGGAAAGPLGSVADGLSQVLGMLTKIASNPAGQAIAAISFVLIGIVGILAAVTAGGLAMAGGLLLINSALASTAATAGIASGALGALKIALISTGIGAAIVALGGITAGLLAASGAFDTAADRSKAFFGDTSTLGTALTKDQAIYQATGEAIQQISTSVGTATIAADPWVKSLERATGAQVTLGAGTSTTTSAIDAQTIAYGANAKAALGNLLANNKAFQDLFSDKDLAANLKKAGGSLEGLTQAILGDPIKGGQDYVAKLQDSLAKAMGGYTGRGPQNNAAVAAQAFIGLQTAVDAASASLSSNANLQKAFAAANAATTAGVTDLNASISDGSGGLILLSKEIANSITSTYAAANAQSALQASTDALGAAFVNSGSDAAVNSKQLQTVLTDLLNISTSSPEAAARYQGLFDYLKGASLATEEQLVNLKSVIDQLSGGAAVTAITFDPTNFVDGQNTAQAALNKTAATAAKAAGAVKTLVDYGNELSGVFKRVDDIRFSGQTGLDAIASGWSKIKTAAASAADSMAKANATLAQLTSDKKINEYWLTVANAYGDTLRASQIQATLAQNAVDTTTAQTALAAAQDSSNKSLVGNSDAAVANRATILGLVTNYQSYITALASSGASQASLQAKSAQLKQEFIQQGTQLGYSSSELATYALSFDDVSTAISKLPRNVTLTFNGDPALQALNEFLAKAKTAVAAGIGNIPTPKIANPDTSGLTAGINAMNHEVWLQFLSAQGGSQHWSTQAQLDAIKKQFVTLTGITNGFAEGGYTGDGGKYQPAGVVHAGEFVFSAAATRNIGVENLAYTHSMAKRGYAEGGLVTGGGSGAPTYTQLSPYDRQLLVDIRNAAASGKLTPGMIAAAGQAANTNTSNRRAA